MNKLQQLKEEARKEFDDYYYSDDIGKDDSIKNFIDSLITKAYEEGKKGKDSEPVEEKSKCCGARASWNFTFKSCSKCGKKFEPNLPNNI